MSIASLAPSAHDAGRPRSATRFRRVVRGSVVGSLVAFVALVFGFAPAANAHDSVTGTTPKNNEVLAVAPTEVKMFFSADPIALGSSIAIKDASGQNWSQGDVDILDNVVTQKVKEALPAGTYTVDWRVVSSDSHPIEGKFAFTVKGSPDSLSTAQPLVSPSSQSSNADSAQQVQVQGEQFPWLIVVFGVVGVALLVIVALLARRKLRSGDED